LKVEITKDPKAESLYVEIHCTDVTEEVSRLERYIKRYGSFIPATKDGEIVSVAVSDILYIESVDKKTFIYTNEKVLLTDKRLYEFESILDGKDFFRCSKSTIIHLNKVVKLKPEITRNILATLENGENIMVSRRYAVELKNLLGIGR
jgi:DNA-binding LytR/AlgR family response regulator